MHFGDTVLIHCFSVMRANVNIGKRANNMAGLLQKCFHHVDPLNKSRGPAEVCRPHFENRCSVESFENTNSWTQAPVFREDPGAQERTTHRTSPKMKD